MTGVIIRRGDTGTSLVVQGVRLCAPDAGGPGSIPGRGTRSYTLQLQLRARMWQLKKIPHATTKILHAATKAINKY